MSTRGGAENGPRSSIARRLDALGTEAASGYASYIRAGDDGRIPCWGAIAERFDSDFESDEQRLEVLDALSEEGDRRALFLFVHLARSRPSLLSDLVSRARSLPTSVQRALISLPEVSDTVAPQLKHFSASVQSAYRNDPDSLRRDSERFENRIRELLAFRFYIPDARDARSEAGADPEEAA